MAALGKAPLEKWSIRNPGPSEAGAGSRETATRCRFESIRNSKNSLLPSAAVDHFQKCCGGNRSDMLHKQNEATSFAWSTVGKQPKSFMM